MCFGQTGQEILAAQANAAEKVQSDYISSFVKLTLMDHCNNFEPQTIYQSEPNDIGRDDQSCSFFQTRQREREMKKSAREAKKKQRAER
jgi:peptide methionine sulfoxide reductase MsrA